MLKPAAVFVCAVLLCPLGVPGQEETYGPLGFLEPLIGTWVGSAEWVAERPGMEQMVPIAFRWGPNRQSIFEQSGLPEDGQLFTVGLITWDPVSQRVEFTSSQSSDSLVFRGHYAPLPGGDIQRTYDVHYRDGSIVRFRETFYLDGTDALDWLTEWEQDGLWVPRRGDGTPEFRAVRRSVDVEEALAPLDAWLGTWTTVDGAELRLAVEDGGPAILTTERAMDGSRRRGLIMWDPHSTGVRGVEVDERGAVLRSRMADVTAIGLTRFVERANVNGTIENWEEFWTKDSDECFVRSGLAGSGDSEARFCRVFDPDVAGDRTAASATPPPPSR